MAVILVFAGVSVSFADEQSDCLANGWMWDNDNKQCCWHYYVTDKDEILCINESNFGNYFDKLGCGYGEPALYIDSDGNPHCCPENSIPNATTHQCRCPSGVLNTTTGQCEVFYLRSSRFCDLWNEKLSDNIIGHFFNYLNKDAISLAMFQSKNTCSAVISKMNDIGLNDVVTGVPGTCDCTCKNPALTFNPDAADQCADGVVSECQNVCIDLTDNREPCPTGQQNYLIDGEWRCCLFYDPSTLGCITDIQTWRTYVNEILNFESGGGYINSEGLPVECPVKEVEGVAVNRETGRCICEAGGWFDTTTGVCINPIIRRNHFGYNDNTQAMTSGMSRIYKHYSQQMVANNTVNSTPHGFFESFGRMVYNPTGQYVYTAIHPATTPANTEYVSTNPSSPGYLDAWPYVYLTLNGNGGTPSVQVKKYNLGMNASVNQVNNATPTRDGYTFNGWWTSSTGGTQVNLVHLGINAVDTTYYAHWTGNSITLNWDENGGGTVTNGSCTYGGNLVLPAAPSRSGYTFNGWKLNNGTIKAAGSTVSGGCISTYTGVTSGTSTHIQAQWSASSTTITLNKNGGSGTCGGATGTTAGSVSCGTGSACALPEWDSSSCNITKGTKIFVGWATSSNATEPNYTTSGTFSGSQTLYAVWKDTYCDYMPSVVQNILGGSPTTLTPVNNAPQCQYTCAHGYAHNNNTQQVKIGTAGNPSSATLTDSSESCNQSICYKFAIDNTTNGGNNNNGATTEFWMYIDNTHYNSANCDIYPTVNDCRNDTNAMSSIVFPNAPTNGYYAGLYSVTGTYAYPHNEGWFNSDGSENIAASFSKCNSLSKTQGYYNSLLIYGFQADSTPSITLRALYECASGYHLENGVCVVDSVTVSYDANGGSGSHALSTTCNVGESCALQTWNNNAQNPCNITNGNKIFLGWSTDPNATTATYTNSGTFTSDTLLYAVWATPTCSVTNGTGTITTPSNNAPRCVVTCNTGYNTSGTYTGTAGGTSVSYTCGVGQYMLTLTDNKETSNTRSLFEIYGNRWASNTNGQPSGTSITTVPGMTRTGYKFRGYYTSDLDDVTSNTSSTTGFKMKTVLTDMVDCAGTNCTETLTSNTEWFAAWAQDCEITHGTCDVTIGTLGQVTYSASCNDGYTLSGGNTSRPTCTPISYTVTFGANGGSGAADPTSVTCIYDQDCTLAAKGTLAKTNATFDGWNTATDGSGDGYLESDVVQNLTTTSGATISLYAVWRTSGCSAGQYLDDGECVSCPAGYSCAGGEATPVICAVNKYSTGGAVSCSSCTGGLTTSSVEDARYHDEAADCGRVLHVGVHEIRLKSIPSTGALSSLVPSPSLRFNYAGNANGRPDFYAKMSTIASPMRVSSTGQISTATSGNKFKTKYNNTNYYVCDDVTCVTE